MTLTEARKRQLRNGVRVICPCETAVEEPGDHIPECPFSDLDWVPDGDILPPPSSPTLTTRSARRGRA